VTRRAEFRVVGLTERDIRERTRRGSRSARAGLLIVVLSALAILYAYAQSVPSVEVVSRVDFGDQRLGVPGHTETIRVSNRGPSALDIEAVTVEGFHLDDFIVSTSACVDPLIEPGGECDIEVRFAPEGEGPRSAELVITDNGRDSPQRVTLNGVGVPRPVPRQPVAKPSPPPPPQPPPPPDPLPRVQITPNLLDFGRRELGRSGLAQTVRMSNVGTGPLVITTVRPAADAPDFRVARETCTGRTVGPGADCEVVVEFTPRAIGVRSAALLLADNAAGSPHQVELRGTVDPGREPAALPRVEIAPDPVEFGRWEVGRSGAPQTVRVRNIGSAPLVIGSLRRSADETNEFDVKSQNCTRGWIAPGEACEVVVQFTPRGLGVRDAGLLLFDNAAGSPHQVRLVGAGVDSPRPQPVPRVEITPNPVDFGARGGEDSRAGGQIVWVLNSGAAPLDVDDVTVTGADERDFAVTSQMCTRGPIAPRERCGIRLEFRPRASGRRAAELLIRDNAPGSPHRVALHGSVYEAPKVPGARVAPGALNFGSALVDRARIPANVQVTSVGTAPLQVTRVQLEGGNTDDFRIVDETCSRSPVRPDTSCTISVEFGPRTVGARNAVLLIADNAPGGPLRVAMTGQGTTPVIPRQPDKPSRPVDTPSATTAQIDKLRRFDALRVDPKGWCCAGGNVTPDSSTTCALKHGTFYPTQDAAQRGCPAVIR
jgi:HYDIN/CFA65/VesB family protein